MTIDTLTNSAGGLSLIKRVSENLQAQNPELSATEASKQASTQVRSGINTLISLYPDIFGTVTSDDIDNFFKPK